MRKTRCSSYRVSLCSFGTRPGILRPFQFPDCQKIHISKTWGFTKFNADECEDMIAEKLPIPDGCGVKYIPNHGPLEK
ncbi:hypothetical protein STEG23_024296, partial [Scotinomys teguina]